MADTSIPPNRPIGITVLVILQIVVGIFDFAIAALVAAAYAVALSFFGMVLSGPGIFLVPFVVLFLVLGLFSFVLAYGLWTGKRWAWITAMVLSIIGLVSAGLGLIFGNLMDIVPIVLYISTLAYLNTRPVRFFFGRTVYSTPYPQQAQYTEGFTAQQPQSPYHATTIPSARYRRTMMCPNCLSPVDVGAAYCNRCGLRLR